MTLRPYQTTPLLSHLYKIRLDSLSGLGETLSPRITTVGTGPSTVTVYGAEVEPVGVTLANITEKMALIADDVAIESFNSLPNYIAIIQKTGTNSELTVTSIDLEEDLGLIS
jgi:hypothetical protein